MKIKNCAVMLAFAMALGGGLQTVFGESLPKPEVLVNYTPIQIYIPKNRGSEKFDVKPQPGFDVTLMMNHTVHFAWSNKDSKKFVIKDEKGKKIWEQNISNKTEIDIVPSEIKLKAGGKYLWNIDGMSKSYKFTILEAQIEKEILENLAEIDAENLSEDECVLKKATYLLMLSDEYPNQIDLYWLIAQLISEISPTEKDLEIKKSDLFERCLDHLNKEMF